MNHENTFNMLFQDTEFILLESGQHVLSEYINTLQVDIKEKYKRLVMIKELAKKKLKTTILDDLSIGAILQEINEIYNKKKENTKINNRSFKDLNYDDDVNIDRDLIKHNYIYNSSIIYVDSLKDIKNIQNNVYRILKINDEHNHNLFFSHSTDKPKIFKNHFNLVKHFLLLNPEFKTKFQQNQEGIEISTLDCLVGNSDQIFVLGMLTLNEEGTLQVQDLTKVVNVDVTQCDWGKGYFTQGCMVLVQGYYKSEVLRAKVIVHPTYAWGNLSFKDKYENDYFGAITKAFKTTENINKNINHNNNNLTNKPEENFLLNFLNKDISESKYLLPKTIENHLNLNLETINKSNFNPQIIDKIFESTRKNLSEEFFLIISNPDLTDNNVLTAIDKILSGYNNNQNIPCMIIFIGDFTLENSYNSFKIYQNLFENLANLISKNTIIAKQSYILFIPGPNEFGIFSGFPKHPIIETIINPLKKKLPNIINATNPCRFTIFGKEVVIFRDNLNKKLSRNSVVKCTDINKNKDYYVHTILAQGNLSPVDLSVTSQIWHLSQSMNILPVPDFLILADLVEDFYLTNNKVTVINPGNFSKDFNFNVVFPLKNIVEPSKIDLNI